MTNQPHNNDSILDNLSETPDEGWLESRAKNNEERAVKALLKYLNKVEYVNLLKQRYTERTGEQGLSFIEFRSLFPDCPIYFTTKSIPYLWQINILDLYTRFLNLSIFKAFEEVIEVEGSEIENKAVAMLFEWKELGWMVFHTSTFHIENATSICKSYKHKKYTLTKLQDYASSLKSIWTPGASV